MMGNRFVILDFLRTLAILFLLTEHVAMVYQHPLAGFYGIKGFYFYGLGGFAVSIFLVVSGAALEITYGGKNIFLLRFMARRWLRIYPVYYMSVLLAFCLVPVVHRFSITGIAFSGGYGLWDILLSLTGLYAFIGKWGGPFVSTSWFVGLIMSLYLLFPLFSRAVRYRPHFFILVLFLVSTASRMLVGPYDAKPSRLLDWFVLCRVFEFGLGMYLVRVVKPEAWKAMNRMVGMRKIWIAGSRMSFPLFLVQAPLLAVLYKIKDAGWPAWGAILFYLGLSFGVSRLFLFVDEKMIQKRFGDHRVFQPFVRTRTLGG